MSLSDIVDLTQTDDEDSVTEYATPTNETNSKSSAAKLARLEFTKQLARQTVAMSRSNKTMKSPLGDANILERAKRGVVGVYKALPGGAVNEDTMCTFVTSAGCGNFSISLTSSAIPIMYERMRLHNGDCILWIGYGNGKEPII